MSWLWSQPKSRNHYTAEDVNTWAAMVTRNVTIQHRLACVTDTPNGIDSSVEILPLPDFPDIDSSEWPESRGYPQSYRRLHMWHPEAAEWYGERFACFDLDCLVTGNLDALLSRTEDVLIARGTRQRAPYNGSFLMMTAGARPQVWKNMTPERLINASKLYIGSDQAFIRYMCGPDLPTIGEESGVYTYSGSRFPAPFKGKPNNRDLRANLRLLREPKYPENMRLMFFTGTVKPRELVDVHPFIAKHYR